MNFNEKMTSLKFEIQHPLHWTSPPTKGVATVISQGKTENFDVYGVKVFNADRGALNYYVPKLSEGAVTYWAVLEAQGNFSCELRDDFLECK